MKRLLKKGMVLVSLIFAFSLVAPVSLQNVLAIQTVDAASAQLNKTELKLRVGKSKKLKVTGTTKKVKWSSSKKSVAKVNKNGKVTGKKEGTAVITAKVGNKKLKCSVTVKKAITGLSVKQKTIWEGESFIIDLENFEPLSTDKGNGKWTSSNKKVAAITAELQGMGWSSSPTRSGGSMTTRVVVTGEKPGKTTITASIGSRSFKCKVKVKASKGKLSTTSKTIKAGESFTLTLKNYQGAGDVKWTTSDKTVAALKDHNYMFYSGTAKNGATTRREYATEYEIKGKSPGTATIKVKSGSKTYKCKVTVTE